MLHVVDQKRGDVVIESRLEDAPSGELRRRPYRKLQFLLVEDDLLHTEDILDTL